MAEELLGESKRSNLVKHANLNPDTRFRKTAKHSYAEKNVSSANGDELRTGTEEAQTSGREAAVIPGAQHCKTFTSKVLSFRRTIGNHGRNSKSKRNDNSLT